MQQKLIQIRDAILSLNKPDDINVKGIVMDYLHDSRELKKDLLLSIDIGIVKALLNSSYPTGGLLIHRKRKLNNAFPDDKKRNELYDICRFITGKAKLNIKGNYNSIQPKVKIENSKSQVHSVLNLHLSKISAFIQKNPISKLKFNFKRRYFAITGASLLLTILLITVSGWHTSKSKNLIIEKTKKVELPYKTSQNDNIGGQYLGEITKEGETRRYVLFITHHNNDTLLCSLMDYPFFEYSKVNFAMLKTEANSYKSKFGKATIKNDTMRIASQITPDNFEIWTFVKRIN